MQPLQRWALTLTFSVVLATGCATGSTLRSTASFAPNDPKSQLALARLYEKRGESEKAKQIYLSMVHRKAGQAEVLHRLANLCARTGDWQQAEQHYKRAFALNPENSALLNDIGYAYYMQNRLDEAQAALEEALARDPKNTQALNNLGLVLGSRGQLEQSYFMFARAGSKAEAHANLAFVHAQRREFDEANSHIRTAVALDPRLRSAARSLLQNAQREPMQHAVAAPPARDIETVSHEVKAIGEGHLRPSNDAAEGPSINSNEDSRSEAERARPDGSAAADPAAPADDEPAVPVAQNNDPRPEIGRSEAVAAREDNLAAATETTRIDHAEIWSGSVRTGYVEFGKPPTAQATDAITSSAEHEHAATQSTEPQALAEPQPREAAEAAAPAETTADETVAAETATEEPSTVSSATAEHTPPPSTLSSESQSAVREPVVPTGGTTPVSGLAAALLASLPVAAVALAVFVRRTVRLFG